MTQRAVSARPSRPWTTTILKVGHGGGDAVKLVHQPRLDIVEKLGAHRLGVWGASPFELSQKRIRELLSEWRLWTACITNEKAHGYTVSISAFSRNTVEIVQISTLLEKQKRFIICYLSFILLLFRIYSSFLV